eukprot:9158667-Pyramimonas_sp.AAC.1
MRERCSKTKDSQRPLIFVVAERPCRTWVLDCWGQFLIELAALTLSPRRYKAGHVLLVTHGGTAF